MGVRLKGIEGQVIVLTGASSGIGLSTARLAASRGARLVLVARNEGALRQLTAEIKEAGGESIAVAADVGVEADVRRVARLAVDRFGGFDTWINDAGASVYGPMIEVSTDDHRRLFETNFWGVVYGSLEAARHFKSRAGGDGTAGAIVNVGSILSDRAITMQGMYSASKHAVKGFTDALRMELEEAGVLVSVTLVKPGSIDTPFPQHARNYMDEEPTLPPPVYAPEVVARAILHCAENPERDVTVGGGGKAIVAMGRLSPRLTDKAMEGTMTAAQKRGEPPRNPAGALHTPTFGLKERGDYPGTVLHSRAYTAAALHPAWTGLLAVGAGLAVASLLAGASNGRNGR